VRFPKKGRLSLAFIKEYTTKRRLWRNIFYRQPGTCAEMTIFASSKTEPHPTQQKSYRSGAKNLPEFIPKDEWPPTSLNLNPVDFPIWGYMLTQLKNYEYRTFDEFKHVILKKRLRSAFDWLLS
jgi:hypothetical protein